MKSFADELYITHNTLLLDKEEFLKCQVAICEISLHILYPERGP